MLVFTLPFGEPEITVLDVVKFKCIMNFLNKISDEEWAQVVSNYSPQLFHYDKGNSVFIDLLESILD